MTQVNWKTCTYRPSQQKYTPLKSPVTALTYAGLPDVEDNDAGKDTSYTSHALTMAHSNYVYWTNLWKVINNINKRKEPFAPHMRSLA